MLGFFRHLIAVGLDKNGVKGLRITKNFKPVRFEGIWSEVKQKTRFKRQ